MIAFGAALPKIRRQVAADLALAGLPKPKVVATVVRLLDTTHMRVGNEEYAKENESFGLTTLRNKHVQIEGRTLRFHFRGKSGQEQEIELTDQRLARIVKQCQDLPGYELFEYLDDGGQAAHIDSSDINEYLKTVTGEDFTAKDFRTWAGTGLMALALEGSGPCDTATARKKQVVASVKSVAQRLGNRPATAKSYYIHPAILEAYEDGSLFEEMQRTCPALNPHDPASLRREEMCILGVIEKYVNRAAAQTRPTRAA
jgi:DNA topoisomerase-1